MKFLPHFVKRLKKQGNCIEPGFCSRGLLLIMDTEKQDFIINELIPRLKRLSANAAGIWGKMNAQQMVEHLSRIFNVSSGKSFYPLLTPLEDLPKYRQFLLGDKVFRENTIGPEGIVPKEPAAARNNTYLDALDELQLEINDFVKFFTDNPGEKTMHPVFGELNFEEWVLIHYKHVQHHARQFGMLD